MTTNDRLTENLVGRIDKLAKENKKLKKDIEMLENELNRLQDYEPAPLEIGDLD